MRRVEKLYRVKNRKTGEIIEGEVFKSVYHCVLAGMKSDLHYSTYNDYQDVLFEYGTLITTDVPGKRNYLHSEFYPERTVCSLVVTGIEGSIRVYCNGTRITE